MICKANCCFDTWCCARSTASVLRTTSSVPAFKFSKATISALCCCCMFFICCIWFCWRVRHFAASPRARSTSAWHLDSCCRCVWTRVSNFRRSTVILIIATAPRQDKKPSSNDVRRCNLLATTCVVSATASFRCSSARVLRPSSDTAFDFSKAISSALCCCSTCDE